MFFLYHSITYQTDQNLLSYHSISSLPTHTQGFSFTTHCLFSDGKAVFSVGGWPGDLTPPCTAYGRMHTGADAFFCTAGHPYCSSISSFNSFSKQPTVQYARYSILVLLLLNQPWRTVRGSWCERKEHTCEVKPTWVWELTDSLGHKRGALHSFNREHCSRLFTDYEGLSSLI